MVTPFLVFEEGSEWNYLLGRLLKCRGFSYSFYSLLWHGIAGLAQKLEIVYVIIPTKEFVRQFVYQFDIAGQSPMQKQQKTEKVHFVPMLYRCVKIRISNLVQRIPTLVFHLCI